MENRKRKNNIHLRFSDEEYEYILNKFKESNCKSVQEFILKCVDEELIFDVDITPLKEISYNLSQIGNNINQIAKRCNETRNFFLEDIEELQEDYEILRKDYQKDILFIRKKFKNTKVKKGDIKKLNGSN
ncbi:plasmid mobilization protein [Parvimonas parva]|uniref:Plasmid mobilization relaxosome protein MobC n=1 Tax=Parvimonas parva TaxID=2769485 RepID=A0ABS1CA80_9FIRM|nr:plasmid mobilization relaxosome protein MobC [Parvimonas parva]MBK1469017.1 plasmid mobilization relaxosome protein MobC [Parvimonas parva]